MYRKILVNRSLLKQLVIRDIHARYKGSYFGVLWSFINPIMLLVLYSFIFGVVFQARWPGVEKSDKLEFSLLLYLGLITHTLLAECVIRSPLLITQNANFVKKLVFPIQIVPVSIVGSAFFHYFLSFLIWLIVFFIVNHYIHWSVLFIPVLILPFLFLCIGVSWILSSIGTYVRDIGQLTSSIAMALLFLAPIFYPSSSLPGSFQDIIYLNPLTYIVEQVRLVSFYGEFPSFYPFLLYSFGCFFFFCLGWFIFSKLRSGFSDVL